jgi:hypothetical protein
VYIFDSDTLATHEEAFNANQEAVYKHPKQYPLTTLTLIQAPQLHDTTLSRTSM